MMKNIINTFKLALLFLPAILFVFMMPGKALANSATVNVDARWYNSNGVDGGELTGLGIKMTTTVSPIYKYSGDYRNEGKVGGSFTTYYVNNNGTSVITSDDKWGSKSGMYAGCQYNLFKIEYYDMPFGFSTSNGGYWINKYVRRNSDGANIGNITFGDTFAGRFENDISYTIVLRWQVNRSPGVNLQTPFANAVKSYSDRNVTLTSHAWDDDGHQVKVQTRIWKNGGWQYFTESGLRDSGSDFAVSTGDLSPGDYWWSANATDAYGRSSGWLLERKFSIAAQTVTLSYDGNTNSSGSPPDPSTVDINSNTTVAGNTGNLAKDSYVFAGWNTDSAGTGTNYSGGSTINMTGDIVLYARWESDATLNCSLRAIPAGGTLPLTVSLEANPTTNAPSPSFTFDWDFNDGTPVLSGSLLNPITHVYTTSGSKTPTVRVYLSGTTLNCPSSVTFTVNPWSGGDQNEVAP